MSTKGDKAKNILGWIVFAAFIVTAVAFAIYFFGGVVSLFTATNVAAVAAQITTWTGGIASIVGLTLVLLGYIDVSIGGRDY